jgi:hypothetical protein
VPFDLVIHDPMGKSEFNPMDRWAAWAVVRWCKMDQNGFLLRDFLDFIHVLMFFLYIFLVIGNLLQLECTFSLCSADSTVLIITNHSRILAKKLPASCWLASTFCCFVPVLLPVVPCRAINKDNTVPGACRGHRPGSFAGWSPGGVCGEKLNSENSNVLRRMKPLAPGLKLTGIFPAGLGIRTSTLTPRILRGPALTLASRFCW